ncbi:tripartite tricarboxylate transporter TctB family protein [Neorhizobium alkalisoli]|uniref:Putative tricarboxylic transport membrane protein n=1 Tax=Neorhizobium alkalisoli TaxID=528178 RepID=A0A561QQW1_9HYPH|nr:tripartite tricarboxylate transporter TctB family protein [Neorhizobium alkalisoli]TWF52798.1 putative tricarboxylic transport membrane protein [Neorhizobium alkalisoli]
MSVDNNNSTGMQRRPDWAALVIAAILVIIAGVIFFDVSRLRDVGGYSQVGPATVPDWIAFGLIGLAIWTVFAAFRGDFPEREKQEIKPVVWIVAGLAAQMLLINGGVIKALSYVHLPSLLSAESWEWVTWILTLFSGFSIATGVLFGLTAAGFGAKRIWISIPIAVVICLFIWWLFAVVLQLSLPNGPLEDFVLQYAQ